MIIGDSMKKCVMIILVVLSFLPVFIKAKECDWGEISAKKNLARNIDWSYEYYLENNKMYFDITISNVYEDLYIVDTTTSKKYAKSEFTINKIADNQKLKFEIYSSECDEQVATKDISLPAYNKYYGTEYCEGIKEFSSCKKWQILNSSVTEDVIKQKTNEYRENLNKTSTKVIEYETNSSNFYVFVGLVLLALTLLLIFIIRGRREKDFI